MTDARPPRPPPPGDDARRRRGLLARLFGSQGERAAVRTLRARGYRILGRNLRTPRGELDVLAEHDGMLVLVEVKSTQRQGAAPPLGRLGGRQRERLEAIGLWLTSQHAFRGRGFRLDLVAVTLDQGAPVVTIRPDAL